MQGSQPISVMHLFSTMPSCNICSYLSEFIVNKSARVCIPTMHLMSSASSGWCHQYTHTETASAVFNSINLGLAQSKHSEWNSHISPGHLWHSGHLPLIWYPSPPKHDYNHSYTLLQCLSVPCLYQQTQGGQLWLHPKIEWRHCSISSWLSWEATVQR